MDPIRPLSGIPTPPAVGERKGGGQGSADAFQRAMQERGDDRADERHAAPERPLRRPLQRQGRSDRRDGGEAMHIDVVA